MKHSEVIKAVFADTGTRQKDVAEWIGAKSQSVVSERINQKNISVKALLEILGALGYEIVVRKSDADYQDGEYPIRLVDYE